MRQIHNHVQEFLQYLFRWPKFKEEKLSSQEYKERREKEKKEKWLCFHCDEKYEKGHKCKNKKLYKLEIIAAESEEE